MIHKMRLNKPPEVIFYLSNIYSCHSVIEQDVIPLPDLSTVYTHNTAAL